MVEKSESDSFAKDAERAGLRYESDSQPGIARIQRGAKVLYHFPDGRPVKEPRSIERIRSLAVPPAWRDVWIAVRADAHLQATGRDARGRKQYRYHADFRSMRESNKFDRLIDFARVLPKIRRRVAQDLKREGLPREKVLAGIVRLLEQTQIRVGNDEYARTNGSFGLTTFRNRHAKVNGSTVRFEFRGKSGVHHTRRLADSAIARLIRKCQELPGQQLFAYRDESGHVTSIASDDVNEYVREITGDNFTAKDFRTWSGTAMAAEAFRSLPPCETETEAKRNVLEVVLKVANSLGNTPTVCRKCYIHPAVLEDYLRNRSRELQPGSRGRKTPGREVIISMLRGPRAKKAASR